MQLKFKDNYPSIKRIFQWGTFTDLLEGVPTPEICKRNLEITKQKTKQYFDLEKIYLITPLIEISDSPRGPQFNEIGTLPKITCIAELSHYQPIKEKKKECSRLGLIWYQDNYAFPIDLEIINKIQLLSWADLSEDDYL